MSDLFELNIGQDNTPEFSVSEVSRVVKKLIENEFSYLRVRGELGRVFKPSSGHIYVDLKDDKSVLSGIIWKQTASILSIMPEEGMEVIAIGRLTTFAGQSRYQIIIEHLSPAGVGALMAMMEKTKQRLRSEGLFEIDKKMTLPFLPSVIGVITSPSGAVIKDILHRLKDRFPSTVIIWPVTVQGENCAREVSAAIKKFNSLSPSDGIPTPNVIIIARGGGSVEDLWGFNEEIVIRAAARSQIPIISAIGHETDTTLLDYVADKRAPTPSAAAEMIVPVRADLIANLSVLDSRRERAIISNLENKKSKLYELNRMLPKSDELLSDYFQKFDMLSSSLVIAIQGFLTKKKLSFVSSGGASLKPKLLKKDILEKRKTLDSYSARLELAICQKYNMAVKKYGELGRLHESLSYRNTLARGYTVIRDESGRLITLVRENIVDQKITIEFVDGTVDANTKKRDIS